MQCNKHESNVSEYDNMFGRSNATVIDLSNINTT